MDIESDDSERWEDFFGSSTELAPSLLGIYDTLTSVLDGSNKTTNNNNSNNNNSNNSSFLENVKINEYCSSKSDSNEIAIGVDVHSNGNTSVDSNHSDSPTLSNKSSRSSSFESEEKSAGEYSYSIDNCNNNSSNCDSNRSKSNCSALSEQQQQQYQKQQPSPSLVPQNRHSIESPPEAASSLSSSSDSGFVGGHNPTLTLFNLAYSNSHNQSHSHSAIKHSYSQSSRSLNSLSSSSSCSQRSNSSGSGGHNSPLSSRLSRDTPSVHSSGSNRSLSNSPSKLRNQIRILSPNVQRIITHSNAEHVETVDIDALQQQQTTHLTSPLQSPALHHRYIKKAPPPGATSTPNGIHKVKLSHIPLSKITGKLTQSGNELVETFDSSSEYLDALSFHSYTEAKPARSLKKPPTPAVVNILGVDESVVDGEVTPTNKCTTTTKPSDPPSAFNFGSTYKLSLPNNERQESIKLIEMEQLAATTQMINAAASSVPTPEITPLAVEQKHQKQNNNNSSANNNDSPTLNTPPPIPSKEFIATAPLSPCDIVEALNYPLITKELQTLTLNDKQDAMNCSMTSVELIEAINKPVISKPLVRSSSAACASTVSGSPMLTYARSKSLAAKANTLGGAVPIKLPTAQQLEELEEASKMSAESLDRLTDIKSKFSPKESRKGGPMLPEIAKLKHRPLSSSSICSTSSSSSSGSDHLNGKLATSYLASVESLADQSENELMDPHSGMSVLERAMLEIVDSERSFVEDLGQVIRGYLSDWKERACLRYDELKILFSNIEEIYEFNSTLLKQLINSGMDPGKIAKCFIDLREGFDVYTTYCTSYPEAISLLTKLLQATHTNALLTSTQKMLQHKLPLGSYLLKPVQRILKYHLLLDNLRKHCDVKEVLQAYEIMRQVARNIDQVKRKLEQQIRVKELSGILDGWLGPELTVLGELRQEGLLMEHNKPRMVFLFDTMLIITKSKEDNRLQFKSYIHQNNLMLSEHLPGEPTSFYVIPYHEPRNQIKLTAKNRDQKRLWAQHIKGVILEKFDNIPNRAKELVYKLGDEEVA
ncbi:myosin-M heavy chain isoform X2 [Ceratitis capitata]|uniref:myosin-M heavy chain isoform X2 n=1 Tax=Ceratitis capitata TaxID=7213 RepID=UPI000A0F9E79|nr:myosin-M heavy chain isoform X2 [Ceratitis capitata]